MKRACHTCSGISVNLCDNISTQYGNITEALVVSVTAIDEESVQLYCKLHKAWVHHRSKRKDSNKYLFIYDLRDNEVTQSAVEMMTLLKQKIQMHQDLIPVYEKKLLCTAILINSESIKKNDKRNFSIHVYTLSPGSPNHIVERLPGIYCVRAQWR